ncbi:hypothetical protein [Streptomyces doebereineriae]|uniref:Uncharacterized protein n=1 Tax=Streptomyces doebereineriae TaxID=3075528 RepID=A0ABU2V1J5_9ACTN|nr:hypothetical protein [Streptomyces sp. DSM 41640]MDT0479415.1 hypothetical protein [Streptomyces sp. DSM 41640]
MSDLLDHALDAHGGLDSRRRAQSIHVQGSVGGHLPRPLVLWPALTFRIERPESRGRVSGREQA